MTVTPTAQGAHARLANDLAGRRRPRRWRPLAAAMLALALLTGAGASAIAAERADDPATVDASAERASSPNSSSTPSPGGPPAWGWISSAVSPPRERSNKWVGIGA